MNPKLKRGTLIHLKAEKIDGIIERDRQDGTVLIKLPNKPVEQQFFDTTIDNIAEVRKGFKTPVSKPKVLSSKEKTEKQLLNEFFDKVALRMPYLCDNCNKPLYAFNKFAKRSCSAHIFPKAQFKNIAMDEDNIFFLGPDLLGICDCHDSWDKKGVEHRKTMNVYHTGLWAFEALKHKMTDKEVIQAYTYLGLEWE